MKYMIRNAVEKDVPSICELYNERNYKDEVLHYSENSFKDCINKIRVYEIDNEVVGFILFYDMGRWCFIDLLSVKENFRNKGIGNELIESLSDFKWHYVFTSVILEDEKALRFVDKCGFKRNNQLTQWFYKENN